MTVNGRRERQKGQMEKLPMSPTILPKCLEKVSAPRRRMVGRQ